MKTTTARFALASLLTVGVCLASAPLASAQIGIESAGISMKESASTLASSGVLRQAGAHADFTTKMDFVRGTSYGLPNESPRDIEFDLPPGLVANPTAVPTCSMAEFSNMYEGYVGCSSESRVGLADVYLGNNPYEPTRVELYNLDPPANAPALLGFSFEGVPAIIIPRLRPDDYGISAGSFAISQALPVVRVDVTLWGTPKDPINESGATGPVHPYVRNPTSCSHAPAIFRGRADSWQTPGQFTERSFSSDTEGTPFVFEGCESLPFAPSVVVQPVSRMAESPTGLNVDIELPQNEANSGFATSDLRSTTVTFPNGMSVSTPSAAGLGACSPSEIGIGSNTAPTCPESSKIGTVEIDTPLLDQTLQGDVILAKQKDNPFGSLLAMYLAVKGPGFYLKLPGKIDADQQTGQLTATFTDTPQLPFEELRLQLKSGPRAPLTTPRACGTYTTTAKMTPWSGTAPVRSESSFTIDEGCDNASRFTPRLEAGSSDRTAGAFSRFLLKVTREDGQQNLGSIKASLPEGLLAKLAGVPLCGDAAAATGNCPSGSQVGTTTVAVGGGSSPLYVPQAGKAPTAIYLAGPYKGAPYSLVVKVPAQAGPFDLGTVTVRNALNVDPVTTQVTASSDPLPQILEGIPITYRSVYIDINRDRFTLNPTSCDPMAVNSTLISGQGLTASPSDKFQVSSCERLGFKPGLALRLFGGTKRTGHPRLRAVLKPRSGHANIERVSVALPHSEFLDQAHIRTVCTRVQFAADQCPAGAIYGYATAYTPLLDEPLQGPVYLRSSNNRLPDLVADLHGQIDVELAGRIDSFKGGIRTTFDRVPDAPVTKFVLSMKGGRKGLLVNSRNLCRSTNRATVLMDGQNGKTADRKPAVANSCKRAAKNGRRVARR